MADSTKKQVTRRNLLVAGGIGAVVLAGAGTAAWLENQNQNPATDALPTPKILRSRNGLLALTLSASYITKNIDGKDVKMLAYNGSVPGPTLHLQPGDTLKIRFENRLGVTTNLHTHGLHVSPEGNGDNPFIMIADGEGFNYEYQLPSDHPAGTYWYHPHHHGQAANQVFGGLYGAIVVANPAHDFSTERVLVISDTSIASDGSVAGANMMSRMMGREGDYLMVNGQLQPQGHASPGATERWRIINACTSRNLNLSLVGADSEVIAMDGHDLPRPASAKGLFLSPGNRADLSVKVSTSDISLNYTTVPHPDSMGMMDSAQSYSNYPLVTLKPHGTAIRPSLAAFAPSAFEDLREHTPNASREFVLNMPGMGNMMGMMGGGMAGMAGQFTINGASFHPNRIDTNVVAGQIEEWTIRNTSTMAHPFHLHVWPMQLLSVNGEAVSGTEYRDVINIPAKGEALVRVRFADFKGAAVYHCHILDHEDFGMMGIIQAT